MAGEVEGVDKRDCMDVAVRSRPWPAPHPFNREATRETQLNELQTVPHPHLAMRFWQTIAAQSLDVMRAALHPLTHLTWRGKT